MRELRQRTDQSKTARKKNQRKKEVGKRGFAAIEENKIGGGQRSPSKKWAMREKKGGIGGGTTGDLESLESRRGITAKFRRHGEKMDESSLLKRPGNWVKLGKNDGGSEGGNIKGRKESWKKGKQKKSRRLGPLMELRELTTRANYRPRRKGNCEGGRGVGKGGRGKGEGPGWRGGNH